MTEATAAEQQALVQAADQLRQGSHRLTGGAGGMDIVNDALDHAVQQGAISADRAGELYMALSVDQCHEIQQVFMGLKPAVASLDQAPVVPVVETAVEAGVELG